MRVDPADREADDDLPLRVVLDALDIGVCVVDAEGRITLYNRRLPEILGLPESLLAGRPSQDDVIRFQASRGDLDALGIDTEAQLTHVSTRIQGTTEPIRYERTGRDGRIIDVLITPLADGRQIRTFADVTAQRHAERRLAQKEALLAEVLAGLDAEVTVYDADGAFLLGNRRFRESNPHLPPDAELIGRKYADLVRLSVAAGAVADPQAKIDPETYVARRSLGFREGRATAYEHRRGADSHMIRTHRAAGFTIQFAFDVAEQKQREEELATKLSLIELALENLGDGLAVYDRDINIVFHNRQMRDFFGFPEDLLRGKAAAERMARFLALRGRYGGGDPGVQVERVLSGFRRRERYAYEHKLPDGRTIEVQHLPLKDGNLLRRYVEISDRKRPMVAPDTREPIADAVLESLGEGIALFDGELKLAYVNRAALRCLGVTKDEVARDPSAAAIFRGGATRGLYGGGDVEGKVAELMSALRSRTAGVAAWTRPDGTIVEIRHLPLDDGRVIRRFVEKTASAAP